MSDSYVVTPSNLLIYGVDTSFSVVYTKSTPSLTSGTYDLKLGTSSIKSTVLADSYTSYLYRPTNVETYYSAVGVDASNQLYLPSRTVTGGNTSYSIGVYNLSTNAFVQSYSSPQGSSWGTMCFVPSLNRMYIPFEGYSDTNMTTFAGKFVYLDLNTKTQYSTNTTTGITGIAYGNDGFIYVTWQGNKQISKQNTSTGISGAFTTIFSDANNNITGTSLAGIALGTDNNLYVLEYRGNCGVHVITKTGTYVKTYVTLPIDIYVGITTPGDGTFFVCQRNGIFEIPAENSYVQKTTFSGIGISVNGTSDILLKTSPPNCFYNVYNNVLYYVNGGRYSGVEIPNGTVYSFLYRYSQITFSNVPVTSLSIRNTNNLQIYSGSTPIGSPIPVTLTCFLEGTTILCFDPQLRNEKYVPVEQLRNGNWVKTARSGYKQIHCIGRQVIVNPPLDVDTPDRIFCYRTSQPGCEGLFQDLFVTGNHCALLYDVDDATLAQVRKHMGDVFVTEGYYRVPACLDNRATPLDAPHQTMTIWHFALEHDSIYKNYGVYANGLLVESSSIRYMTELSGMQLLQ